MNEIIQQIVAYGQQYMAGQIDYPTFEAQARPLVDQLPEQTRLDYASIMPGFIKNAVEAKDQADFEKRIQSTYGALKGAVDLTQLVNSYNQIKTAQQAARSTPPVSFPTPPGQNTQLSEELYSAQRRANDIGYAINPAVQQLNQSYTQALNQAQAASGGQSANYQALANLANQQRMQAALGLVPAAQDARMQNQAMVNQLLGQRLQEQQSMFDNQMASIPYQYDRWQRTQDAIGALGSQGRTYAFDAISRIPDYLQYLPFDEESNNFIRDTHQKYKNYQFNPSPNNQITNPANSGQMMNQQPHQFD